jgi:predicted ATPase
LLSHELIALARTRAKQTGVLVIIEDVESADEATLSLLGHGLARLVGSPIAMLLTCGDSGPGASQVLNGALAHVAGSLDVITLQPLSRCGVSTLAGLVSGRSFSKAAVAKIHRLTRGNPSMVRKVCLSLAAGIRLSDIQPYYVPNRVAPDEA